MPGQPCGAGGAGGLLLHDFAQVTVLGPLAATQHWVARTAAGIIDLEAFQGRGWVRLFPSLQLIPTAISVSAQYAADFVPHSAENKELLCIRANGVSRIIKAPVVPV